MRPGDARRTSQIRALNRPSWETVAQAITGSLDSGGTSPLRPYVQAVGYYLPLVQRVTGIRPAAPPHALRFCGNAKNAQPDSQRTRETDRALGRSFCRRTKWRPAEAGRRASNLVVLGVYCLISQGFRINRL